MYTVYSHVFPNGKRYIGITMCELEKRWGNGHNYTTCRLVDRAIKKYGWENINHAVLDTAETKELAEEKEKYWISFYNSNDPKCGYNILPGGDVATNEITDEMRVKLGSGWRGKHRSEEEKKKIAEGVKKKFERKESNGHFGMKHTEEAKKKMSQSQKDRWNDELREQAAQRMRERMSNPEYKKRILDNLAKHKVPAGQKHMSDEQKEKLSKHFKGMWIGEKSPCSKPVLQFTKDGKFVKRWANAGEAQRAGITNRGNISNCCHNRVKSAGGYVWKFEEE